MGFFHRRHQPACAKRAGLSAITGLPLILLAASTLAQAQPTASRVLVVYQTNAPDKDGDGMGDSRQLAEYYSQKRGVPLSNLLGVTPTPAGGYYYQTSEYGKFQSEIVAPIKAKLGALGATSIDIILLAGALPTAVADIDGAYTSVDNFLMGLNFYSATTNNISWKDNPYGVDFVAGAPSIGPDAPHFNHSAHRFRGTTMYLVGRLGSSDSLAGLEQLDQSLYAERFLSTNPGYYNGNAYVDSYSGQPGIGAKFTDAWLSSVIHATPSDYATVADADIWIAYAEHFVTAAGLPLKWENTVEFRSIGDPGATYSDGAPATVAPRALFYGGWYNFSQYNDVWEWLPGSVLCDLDSSSYFFAGQAFARGASNASYVIGEPFLDGHPRPSVLYYYILKGYSFAEASALATPSIGWKAVNEGDPLYAPMAPHVAVLDTHAPVLSAGYPAVTLRSGSDWIVRTVIGDSAEPEVARAKVDYGLTSAYGSSATSGQGYWRRPQVVLPGLVANTVYHYRLTLTDPVGNVTTTGDLTFITSATVSNVSVAVSPTTATLNGGQTQSFTATVTGTSNTAVTWAINPVLGTISSTGVYTAPATIVTATTVSVTATSVADASKFATGIVSLTPPAPGGGGPQRVQSKGAVGTYSNSVSVTFNNPTTSGNQLVMVLSTYYATEGIPFSISDSRGNTWKTAIDHVNGGHIVVFYAENIVGGAGETVTVTAPGPSYFSVTGVEYSGLAKSNSLDVTATSRATGASYSSPAATIASGNELLLGVHHVWSTGVSFTPTSGWSTVGMQVGYDETQVQDRIVLAAGPYASTGAESSPNDTVSVLVAFKAESGLAPTIFSFTASPATIVSGQSSMISWNTAGATAISINPGIGAVASSGSTTVNPVLTTTYTLSASNTYGTTTAQTTITVDTAGPSISSILTSSVTSSSVAVSWNTNINADSQVEYGTSASYGLSSPLDTSLLTSHNVVLSGLAASTLYHYRVKSRNSSGALAISADYTFTTAASGGGSVPLRVQSKGAVGTYSNSVSVTFNNPTTSGNHLVLVLSAYYAADGAPFSISDTKGNTWKTAIDHVNGTHIVVFYAENIIGGAGETVTVTASGPSYFSVTGVEYSGLAKSNSLDVTATSRATGASYSSPAATIASGNELLLGVHHVWSTGVSFTPTSGWSTVVMQVGYDETQVQDRIVLAAGSYASTGTESSSNDTVSVLVVFKGQP